MISEKGILLRSSLRTDDDTATFEHLQKLTAAEAEQFAEALSGAAKTYRKMQEDKPAEDVADKAGTVKRRRAKTKASKKRNRAS